MLHAPISQILTPAWETWQTARFSVFAHQSHADVDAARDLTDMLNKLEDRKVPATDDESRALSEKRKRKFLELAVPCGALSVVCVIYCLVYLSLSGTGIASTTQWRSYQETVGQLEQTVSIVLEEYCARMSSGDDVMGVPAYVYDRTDEAVDRLLTAKTLVEWRLISSLNDWRSDNSGKDSVNVVNESLFYLKFMQQLQNIIYARALEFSGMGRWKMYYNYQRTAAFCIELHVMVCFWKTKLSNGATFNVTNSTVSEYMKLVPKFHMLLHEYSDKTENRSLSYSFKLLTAIFPSINSRNNSDVTFPFNDEYFNNLKLFIHAQRRNQFEEIQASNDVVFRTAVISFCLSFLGLCVTVICTVGYGFLLRKESRLAVLVADWFSHLEARVEEQKENTYSIASKIVPRMVLSKYDGMDTMIPFVTSDTTLFMSSIAHFDSLFDVFSPQQTLQILTFVLELLDERIEQYNVFPVTRMGHVLMVVSDSGGDRRQVQQACEIANLALDIMTCCSDLEIGRHATSKLLMKVAIHSGQCTGRLVVRNGTVQLRLIESCLDILEHIHRAATPNMIHMSETTYRHLNTCDTYCLHYRGNINIKGNCKHRVYWLNGRRVSSVTAFDRESTCSRMGSWIELEKKPLYRLDEVEGVYEPVTKASCKRYSQMSIGSYVPQMSPVHGCVS